MRTTDKFVNFLGRKMPLPPDHVPGREYHVELLRNAPTEPPYTPIDWNINRYEKYSDVIELKPDSEPGGKVSQLCKDGTWEIINVLKNITTLGKLKPT